MILGNIYEEGGLRYLSVHCERDSMRVELSQRESEHYSLKSTYQSITLDRPKLKDLIRQLQAAEAILETTAQVEA